MRRMRKCLVFALPLLFLLSVSGRQLASFEHSSHLYTSTDQDESLVQGDSPHSPNHHLLFFTGEEIGPEDHEDDREHIWSNNLFFDAQILYTDLMPQGWSSSSRLRHPTQPRLFILFHCWKAFLN